jgi:hypothetical protein
MQEIQSNHPPPVSRRVSKLGLGTEFRSEKIRGIDSERFPLFRGRKHSFRAIPSSAEEPIPKLGTERNEIPRKKLLLRNSSKITWQNELSVHQKSSFLTLLLKYSAAAFCSELVSLPRNGSPERHSESLFLFFGIPERNSELCSLPQNDSERNSRICIYFGSTERNSELCSLPKKSSEQSYGSLLLSLFHRTEFRVIFYSGEGFGREFRDFLFRGTTGIPSEITNCSVYSVFHVIIFLLEIPNSTVSSTGDARKDKERETTCCRVKWGWGRRGAKTYDRKKVWASINHTILYDQQGISNIFSGKPLCC